MHVTILLLYCTRKPKKNIMPLGTIVGGVTSLFGSGMSYKGQREANKTNIELARQGREHDVDMWNRQNAYNTPEMQMQRLKEAGLNPNLIYGSGQASAGNADAPKPAHVATTSNELATFANNQAISMLSHYQDWQVKKAQIKNIEAEQQNKQIENEYLAASLQDRLFGTKWKGNLAYANAKYRDEQYVPLKYSREARLAEIENRSALSGQKLTESKQRIEYLRKSTRQKELQIHLDEQLKPYGMSTTDALWQRMLAPLFKNTGKGISDFMNNPGKHFKDTFIKK